MTSPSYPDSQQVRQRLLAVRDTLVVLHKTLIDAERIGYEQTFGKLESQNRFLQLLINDPWFAWLHPLSELVVLIDEALDAKDQPLTAEGAARFIEQVRALLKASEEGEGFGRNYFEA